MSSVNTQEEAALLFVNTKRSPVMAFQKVMHLPHPNAQRNQCFDNTHDCVKTDKIVSGYVVSKKSTIHCESGYKTGWAIMPHFWSVDINSGIPLDRTPYDPEITKVQGKPKSWIYIVDQSLGEAMYKLDKEGVNKAPIFANIFVQDNGKIYLVKKNKNKEGAAILTIDNLDWLTLYEAYYSVGDDL